MRMQSFWHDQAASGTWAGHYDGAVNLKTYNFFTRRKAVVDLLEKDGKYGRILDVGCGTGDYIEVAEQHSGEFHGLDYAPGMIKGAIERIPGHGKEHLFLVGSGAELPYRDDTFDLVLAMGYIEYFSDPGEAMRELRRVMKPGAILVMQSFKKDFCGELDRWVIDPFKAAIRPIREAFGAKLGPSRAYTPPDWLDLKYSRGGLDRLVNGYGFKPQAWTYNNFHVFPAFLTLRMGKTYVNLSEKIQRTCPNLFGFLAVNYIAKYELVEKEGAA